MTPMPNRLQAPLTADERLAEQYLDRPERLLEIAAETGNRAMYWSARELLRRKRGVRVSIKAGEMPC